MVHHSRGGGGSKKGGHSRGDSRSPLRAGSSSGSGHPTPLATARSGPASPAKSAPSTAPASPAAFALGLPDPTSVWAAPSAAVPMALTPSEPADPAVDVPAADGDGGLLTVAPSAGADAEAEPEAETEQDAVSARLLDAHDDTGVTVEPAAAEPTTAEPVDAALVPVSAPEPDADVAAAHDGTPSASAAQTTPLFVDLAASSSPSGLLPPAPAVPLPVSSAGVKAGDGADPTDTGAATATATASATATTPEPPSSPPRHTPASSRLASPRTSSIPRRSLGSPSKAESTPASPAMRAEMPTTEPTPEALKRPPRSPSKIPLRSPSRQRGVPRGRSTEPDDRDPDGGDGGDSDSDVASSRRTPSPSPSGRRSSRRSSVGPDVAREDDGVPTRAAPSTAASPRLSDAPSPVPLRMVCIEGTAITPAPAVAPSPDPLAPVVFISSFDLAARAAAAATPSSPASAVPASAADVAASDDNATAHRPEPTHVAADASDAHASDSLPSQDGVANVDKDENSTDKEDHSEDGHDASDILRLGASTSAEPVEGHHDTNRVGDGQDAGNATNPSTDDHDAQHVKNEDASGSDESNGDSPKADLPGAAGISDLTAAKQSSAQETLAGETSAQETPAEEAPAEAVSSEEAPAEETLLLGSGGAIGSGLAADGLDSDAETSAQPVPPHDVAATPPAPPAAAVAEDAELATSSSSSLGLITTMPAGASNIAGGPFEVAMASQGVVDMGDALTASDPFDATPSASWPSSPDAEAAADAAAEPQLTTRASLPAEEPAAASLSPSSPPSPPSPPAEAAAVAQLDPSAEAETAVIHPADAAPSSPSSLSSAASSLGEVNEGSFHTGAAGMSHAEVSHMNISFVDDGSSIHSSGGGQRRLSVPDDHERPSLDSESLVVEAEGQTLRGDLASVSAPHSGTSPPHPDHDHGDDHGHGLGHDPEATPPPAGFHSFLDDTIAVESDSYLGPISPTDDVDAASARPHRRVDARTDAAQESLESLESLEARRDAESAAPPPDGHERPSTERNPQASVSSPSAGAAEPVEAAAPAEAHAGQSDAAAGAFAELDIHAALQRFSEMDDADRADDADGDAWLGASSDILAATQHANALGAVSGALDGAFDGDTEETAERAADNGRDHPSTDVPASLTTATEADDVVSQLSDELLSEVASDEPAALEPARLVDQDRASSTPSPSSSPSSSPSPSPSIPPDALALAAADVVDAMLDDVITDAVNDVADAAVPKTFTRHAAAPAAPAALPTIAPAATDAKGNDVTPGDGKAPTDLPGTASLPVATPVAAPLAAPPPVDAASSSSSGSDWNADIDAAADADAAPPTARPLTPDARLVRRLSPRAGRQPAPTPAPAAGRVTAPPAPASVLTAPPDAAGAGLTVTAAVPPPSAAALSSAAAASGGAPSPGLWRSRPPTRRPSHETARPELARLRQLSYASVAGDRVASVHALLRLPDDDDDAHVDGDAVYVALLLRLAAVKQRVKQLVAEKRPLTPSATLTPVDAADDWQAMLADALATLTASVQRASEEATYSLSAQIAHVQEAIDGAVEANVHPYSSAAASDAALHHLQQANQQAEADISALSRSQALWQAKPVDLSLATVGRVLAANMLELSLLLVASFALQIARIVPAGGRCPIPDGPKAIGVVVVLLIFSRMPAAWMSKGEAGPKWDQGATATINAIRLPAAKPRRLRR
ncbi:hypothetical protein CXG81DRAFT_18903 [Caulochytrium protostelioides]|uniref:Uncharacterized protein n=1 Tax=Caulochytrium protostelioides TaxID=1555241 RepID=A0A4P9X7Q9_9FUNG|nr:hypothetical protein CXG81DRAFT_18903 [Caulochytrium protostelioides]|eukprot:RKP01275.1 hypothetical protein CXG81DRAFT_18903 [Caulochytrium protostelioides]